MIALMAASLTGLPANAPLRSTRCRRRAPASSQRRAMAAGSSPKVVESFMSPCLRRTHLPSFRSIAGISSMAGMRVGQSSKMPDWARREGFRAAPDALAGTRPCSGPPEQEIAIQGQAVFGALFRVELRGENVIPRHETGKADTVLGFAGAVLGIVHMRMVAVNEVEPALVGDARPARMGFTAPGAGVTSLADTVPAHLGHLVAAAIGLDLALEAEFHHLAGDQAQARGVLLFGVVEQHLHAHAHAHQRLGGNGVQHGAEQVATVGFAQLAHAVAHGALTWQHDAFGGVHHLGVVGDHHLQVQVLRGVFHRLRHGAQVAHAVVNHGNGRGNARHTTHSEPLVDGMTPAMRGSSSSAARRARAKALNTVSHWWWALTPRRLSMCRVTPAWLTKPWKNSKVSWVSKPPMLPDVKGTCMVRPGRPEKSTTTRERASSRGT